MNDIDWIQTIVSILRDLAFVIPLLVALVVFIKKAIREKNWKVLLKLVTDLMTRAETLYTNGAAKKQWVMDMLAAAQNTINFDIDYDAVGELIDNLCAMSKVVNGPQEKQ